MRLYKLLLMVPVVMMGFATTNVMAAKTCGPEVLGYSGNQDPDDNEFLYANKSQFDAANAGYKNTNHTTSGSGKGYECDNEHCSHASIVDMPAGHVFKGKVINHKETYQCQANKWDDFDDYWYPVGKGVCHAGKTYGDINVGQKHNGRLSKEECSGFELTDDLGVEFDLICREGPKLVCKAMKCRDDFKADNGKCVVDNKVDPTPNPEPQPKPDPDQKKKGGGSDCLNRPTAEGRACCRAGAETMYDSKTDTCTCVISGTKTPDTTKEWRHADGAENGQCVAKGTPEQPVNPCGTMCETYVDITIVNNNCNTQRTNLQSIKTQVKQQCDQDTKCDAKIVSKLVTQMQQLVVECNAKPQLNEQRLAAAVEAIDKYRSGLDVSVWKDAEGNFNTARLVSDSIAGVVLGTAGGLITSSVVKKNQVKNGFEDVVCTIGGQTVGSYGDEISVGIK